MTDDTTDFDIRSALHAKYLRRAKAHPDTLVIDELGLAHAKCRIDIAVINGCIHGYEIKSAKDTLDRLATQIETYRQALQKLTIVAAPRHLLHVIPEVPDWCGIIVAEQGPRGGVAFEVIRKASPNPEADPIVVAHLLWRDEVVRLLEQRGFQPKDLRQPRKQLYRMLCEAFTLQEITSFIKTFMVQREAWQDRLVHA